MSGGRQRGHLEAQLAAMLDEDVDDPNAHVGSGVRACLRKVRVVLVEQRVDEGRELRGVELRILEHHLDGWPFVVLWCLHRFQERL